MELALQNRTKMIGMVGLCVLSFLALGAVAAMAEEASQQADTTLVAVTVFSDSTSKPEPNFPCVVETEGAVLGTLVAPGNLSIPRRLKDVSVTCSKQGFEPVSMKVSGGPVPASLSPRFVAKAKPIF